MGLSIVALVCAWQSHLVVTPAADVVATLEALRLAYSRVSSAEGTSSLQYFGTLGMPGSASTTTRRTSTFRYRRGTGFEIIVNYPGEQSQYLWTNGIESVTVDLQGVVTRAPLEYERFVAIASTGVATLFLTWRRSFSTDLGGWMLGARVRLERNVAWRGRRWLDLIQERPSDNGVIATFRIDPETMIVHRTSFARRNGQVILVAEETDLRVTFEGNE